MIYNIFLFFHSFYFLLLFFSIQCYKRILQIDPINIQGLHNLCVVYVERGKLIQAFDCLQQAHKLAPEEDYILRHLKIVQQRIANLRQSTLTTTTTQTTQSQSMKDTKKMPSNDATIIDDETKSTLSDDEKIENISDNDENLSDDRTISEEHNSINDKTDNFNRDIAGKPSSVNSDNKPTSTSMKTENTAQQSMHTKFKQQQNQHNKDELNDALPSFVHDLDDPSSGTS